MHARILEKSIFRIRRVAQIRRVRVNNVTIPNSGRTKDPGPVNRRGSDKPALVPVVLVMCRDEAEPVLSGDGAAPALSLL
jgi:hypothetical protein